MTAPQFFARARGFAVATGPERCFYCGGACAQAHSAAKLVKSSFTARDTVCGGDWVCDGCVAAMDERGDVTLLDGTERSGQKLRCYSWIVTEGEARGATKAHRDALLRICLAPPAPPYVICLSDSGQKHLLYRAVVCRSPDTATVTLEAEPVSYRPAELAARVAITKRISAAAGKPALGEPLSMRQQIVVAERFGVELIDLWMRVCDTPLSRLAAWLTPSKKECELEYPPTART